MNPVAGQRILRGVAATLEVVLLDSYGEPAAAAGAVTVSVLASDGTTIQAVTGATTGSPTGTYTLALTAAQTANLDWLTATWYDAGVARATTVAEVVGGFYFTIGEARASDPSLSAGPRYSDADIRSARDEVERTFELILGYPAVPRYGRIRVPGSYRNTMLLPPTARLVRSVTVETSATSSTVWTAPQVAALTVSSGIVLSAYPWQGVVTMGFEYGLERCPSDLKRAALIYLRSLLNSSRAGVPDRASRLLVDDARSFVLATSGERKVGIDAVDGVLARYLDDTPALA